MKNIAINVVSSMFCRNTHETTKRKYNLKEYKGKIRTRKLQIEKYIEKNFEVVNHLFSFPIDSFKRLVDNFIKSLEKCNFFT